MKRLAAIISGAVVILAGMVIAVALRVHDATRKP